MTSPPSGGPSKRKAFNVQYDAHIQLTGVDHTPLVRVGALLQRVTYKDWDFVVGRDSGPDGEVWVQVIFEADGALQKCRKWRLSKFMTDSEIVQTAFAAVRAAEEHETREHFRLDETPIFGPHFSVESMLEFARTANYDVRRDPQP